MLPFLKVNFQEKIPPWLFHRKWSNSSGGDTHRVQSKVLMVPLGTGLLTYLQILHEVHKGLEPRGFSHQFLFVRRLFGSGVPTLPYGFWATRGEMVFPASGWALAPTYLLAQEILQEEGQGKLSVDGQRCFCTPCICLSLSSCQLTTSLT